LPEIAAIPFYFLDKLKQACGLSDAQKGCGGCHVIAAFCALLRGLYPRLAKSLEK